MYALVPKGQYKTSSLSRENDSLQSIYARYASMYPNPRLTEEYKERDRLLQAVNAAASSSQRNQKSSSWFQRLFSTKSSPTITSSDNSINKADSALEYTDELSNVDDGYLGTTASLDTSCIPPEAHSMARFSLVSGGNRPSIVKGNASTMVVVGLGEFVEFDATGQAKSVQSSDYARLQKYDSKISHVRACQFSDRLLAVSWGLTDGITVIYQRVPQGWQAVACVSASAQVREQLSDYSSDSDDNGLLLVSSVSFMLVRQRQLVLVISRLGGTIEFITLPSRLWNGPPVSVKPAKNRRHYALGHVVDLTATNNQSTTIAVVNTAEYQDDILGIEILTLEPAKEWNRDLYPLAPPAEFVVAAFGEKSSTSVVSFWSVHATKPDAAVHVAMVEAIDLGILGPPVTTFANAEILQHWRRPRFVNLSSKDNVTANTILESSDTDSQPQERVTTISISAPITTIKFGTVRGSTLMTVLDYNGGVTILNINLLEKAAAQTLSLDEHKMLNQNDDADTVVPMVETVADRSRVADCLSTRHVPRVIGIELLVMDTNKSQRLLHVVMLTEKPSCLYFVSTSDVADCRAPFSVPLNNGKISIQKSGSDSIGVTIQNNGTLFHGTLQRQSPVGIIKSLYQDAKYNECITAARSLPSNEQAQISDTLEAARKHLWRDSLDFNILKGIIDDTYVVDEALEFSSIEAIHSDTEMIELCKLVHAQALHRLAKARLSTALSVGGVQGTKEIEQTLRNRLIRIGTYELLSRHLKVDCTFQSMLTFIDCSIAELASHFCRSGDLQAATLLYVRHGEELDALDTLQLLPLTIAPFEYCHLIPVPASKDNKNCFISPTGMKTKGEWVQYISSSLGINMFVDDSDREVVMLGVSDKLSSTTTTKVEDVQNWLNTRLLRSQTSTASIESTAQLMLLSHHLDCHLSTDSDSTWGRTLEQIRIFQNLCTDASLLQDQTSVCYDTVDAFTKQSMSNIVSIVFHQVHDSDSLLTRYRKYLLPLTENSPTALNDMYSAIVQFCSATVEKDIESNSSHALNSALELCVNVAKLSSTSIEEKSRILRGPYALTQLFFAVYDVLTSSSSDRGAYACAQALWKMYECLPCILPPENNNNSMSAKYKQRLDKIGRELVIFDISSRWDIKQRKECWQKVKTRATNIEHDTVMELCMSFIDQAEGLGTKDRLLTNLFSSLVSDISVLSELSADNINIKSILTQSVFAKLIHRNDMAKAARLFHGKGCFIDKATAKAEVLQFFNKALLDDLDTLQIQTNLQRLDEARGLAISLQIDIGDGFQDVTTTIQSVLLLRSMTSDVTVAWTPASVQGQSGQDIINSLLHCSPDCILSGCSIEWTTDLQYAEKEIYNLCHRKSDNEVVYGKTKNVLPGERIVELCRILCLDAKDIAIVQTQLVTHCRTNNWFGVAVYLCVKYLQDPSIMTHTQASQVLLAEAERVCVVDSNFNILARRDVCVSALEKTHSLAWSQTISSLLDFASSTEAVLMGKPNDLMYEDQWASALTRLCRSTTKEYNTNLFDFFKDLYLQSRRGTIDMTLLDALSRYAVYWAVSNAVTLHPYDCKTSLTPDVPFITLFSVAIQAYIANIETNTKYYEEVRDILNKQLQASKVKESNMAQFSGTCDAKKVQSLMARGYSLNASRKAVLATNNTGVDEAMRWAVAHSNDRNFEDPLVLLKSQQDTFLSYTTVQLVQEIFDIGERMIKNQLDLGEIERLAVNPETTTTHTSKVDTTSTRDKGGAKSAIEDITNGNDSFGDSFDDAWNDDDDLDLSETDAAELSTKDAMNTTPASNVNTGNASDLPYTSQQVNEASVASSSSPIVSQEDDFSSVKKAQPKLSSPVVANEDASLAALSSDKLTVESPAPDTLDTSTANISQIAANEIPATIQPPVSKNEAPVTAQSVGIKDEAPTAPVLPVTRNEIMTTPQSSLTTNEAPTAPESSITENETTSANTTLENRGIKSDIEAISKNEDYQSIQANHITRDASPKSEAQTASIKQQSLIDDAGESPSNADELKLPVPTKVPPPPVTVQEATNLPSTASIAQKPTIDGMLLGSPNGDGLVRNPEAGTDRLSVPPPPPPTPTATINSRASPLQADTSSQSTFTTTTPVKIPTIRGGAAYIEPPITESVDAVSTRIPTSTSSIPVQPNLSKTTNTTLQSPPTAKKIPPPPPPRSLDTSIASATKSTSDLSPADRQRLREQGLALFKGRSTQSPSSLNSGLRTSSSTDRTSLRERGQSILQSTKAVSEGSDRQRLIEQGRRLFQQSRLQRPSSPSRSTKFIRPKSPGRSLVRKIATEDTITPPKTSSASKIIVPKSVASKIIVPPKSVANGSNLSSPRASKISTPKMVVGNKTSAAATTKVETSKQEDTQDNSNAAGWDFDDDLDV